MKVMTLGQGGRLDVAARILKDTSAKEELILLPVPTTRDKVHLKDTDLKLSYVAEKVSEGVLVAGYAIPDGTAFEISRRGGAIYDASLDEGFLYENAVLTADGTVGHILTELPRAPKDLHIGIVGYGRIGGCLLSRLLFLGAKVTVFSGRERTRLELCESGVTALARDEIKDVTDMDILINTAPAPLLDTETVERLSSLGCHILDLASGRYLPEHSAVTKLASVPDAMYPESAGRIYASHILAHLKG